ncbi:MAG: methyltransferase domain-containing protein [Hyphomicrobiales bacterium]|nr:methyltransferase domain-containing protein [Hyphomicrobiales bacterium]
MLSAGDYEGLYPAPRRFILNAKKSALGLSGFSGPEATGRWTNGPRAQVEIPVETTAQCLILVLHFGCFIDEERAPSQRVRVSANGRLMQEWTVEECALRKRIVGVDRATLPPFKTLKLDFELPDYAAPGRAGAGRDTRKRGLCLAEIELTGADALPPSSDRCWSAGVSLRGGAGLAWDRLALDGFWDRFAGGPNILELCSAEASRGLGPLFENATRLDPAASGRGGGALPLPDDGQDLVFSRHCLEDAPDPLAAIREWSRVTRIGGHVIAAVSGLRLPNRGKAPAPVAHRRFYSAGALAAAFEAALEPNTYRLRHLAELENSDRTDPDVGDIYDILMVVEKIRQPWWRLD